MDIHGSNWADYLLSSWRGEFQVDWTKHVGWHELAQLDADQIMVITDVLHLAGTAICADRAEKLLVGILEALLKSFGRSHSSSSTQVSHAHLDANVQLLAMYPWPAGSLENDARKAKKQRVAEEAADSLPDWKEAKLMGDDEMEEAFGILEAARAKWCSEDDELPDWRVTVVGGAWTAAHKGCAFDAFRAAPKAGSEAES